MRVLMLGWEFPPFISGGLGTACHGLTRGMSEVGAEVLFLLPRPIDSSQSSHVTLLSPRPRLALSASEAGIEEFENVTFRLLEAGVGMPGYSSQADVPQIKGAHLTAPHRARRPEMLKQAGLTTVVDESAAVVPEAAPAPGAPYHGDMFTEVERYARLAAIIAMQEAFDVIHAHDWMTYRAGIAVAALTGKPLVVHVHSTEFDRSGEHVNQRVYDIERQGMHMAHRIIAVSFLTKNVITSRYGVRADKVEVVYNGVEFNGFEPLDRVGAIRRDEKLVLFLGRITMQKGPEYFLAAAKKVLEKMDNVRFIMAGSGDMIRGTIEQAAHLGIGHKVLFTGFLRGKDVERVFRMADLYVMPSVSEPFGIAPLEALSNNVPVIISKQSGVSEVLSHALKVDFWDVDEMANKIVAVLRHPSLQSTLREHGQIEVGKLSWRDSARRCLEIYSELVNSAA